MHVCCRTFVLRCPIRFIIWGRFKRSGLISFSVDFSQALLLIIYQFPLFDLALRVSNFKYGTYYTNKSTLIINKSFADERKQIVPDQTAHRAV